MDNNSFDQWLRASLQDHRPVPDAKRREAFLEASAKAQNSWQRKFLRNKWLWMVVLILISTTLAMFFAFQDISEKPKETSLLNPNQGIVAYDSKNELVIGDDSLVEIRVEAQGAISNTEEMPSVREVTTETLSSNHGFSQDEPASSNGVDLGVNVSENQAIIKTEFPVGLTVFPDTKTEENPILITVYPDTLQPTDSIQHPESGEAIRPEMLRKKPCNFLFSVFYRPEITFNLIDNKKVSQNFGLEVHYRFFNNRYSLRSGLGVSISKGYYEYATQYNEYLGSYSKLDSITFAWDDRNYYLLPTYYKSNQEVFDDTISTDYSLLYKRHYYLLIPVIFGYDFYSDNNWRIGLRAGPQLSILMETQDLQQVKDLGMNKVVQINQITPDRISTNWQIQVGVNIGFETRKRLFFEIEPQFNYYFNSVYESSNPAKTPWSVGLRFSVGFKN